MSVYDRVAELKAFDSTREGVKGLVDAGVTEIPRIFIHPPDEHDAYKERGLHSGVTAHLEIPVVDLDHVTGDGVRRQEAVEEVRRASETWGFFQVVKHGIPLEVLEAALKGGRAFFEQGREAKAKYYTREPEMSGLQEQLRSIQLTGGELEGHPSLFHGPGAGYRRGVASCMQGCGQGVLASLGETGNDHARVAIRGPRPGTQPFE